MLRGSRSAVALMQGAYGGDGTDGYLRLAEQAIENERIAVHDIADKPSVGE